MVKSVFTVGSRIATVIGTADPEGGNMLTTTNLLAWYDVWANTSSLTFKYNDTTQSLKDVCITASDGSCQFTTILSFWDYNRTRIASQTDAELNQTIVDAGYTVCHPAHISVGYVYESSAATDGTAHS